MHHALVCREPDVGCDQLLPLIATLIIERTLDCFLAASLLAESVLDIEQRLLHFLCLFRAPAHLHELAGMLRMWSFWIVGMPSAPHCGAEIGAGMLLVQHFDLFVAELVPRHQDDNALVGVLDYVQHGSGAHQRGLAATGRRYQQHD